MFYSVLKVVIPCYTIRETKKPNVQYNAQYKTIYTCINYNTLGGSSDLGRMIIFPWKLYIF